MHLPMPSKKCVKPLTPVYCIEKTQRRIVMSIVVHCGLSVSFPDPVVCAPATPNDKIINRRKKMMLLAASKVRGDVDGIDKRY